METQIIYIFIISYLLGSIAFGLILTKLSGAGDLRSIGSGNIGATNVMRTGRKGLAIATLLLDALKGAAAVLICTALYPEGNAGLWAGLFVVLGHIFPIWLKFKGGKGVATALGVFFALNPLLGLFVCALWLAVFLATRFSSLAAVSAVTISPTFALYINNEPLAMFCAALAAIIIFTHRENIKRLIAGTEHSFKKKE